MHRSGGSSAQRPGPPYCRPPVPLRPGAAPLRPAPAPAPAGAGEGSQLDWAWEGGGGEQLDWDADSCVEGAATQTSGLASRANIWGGGGLPTTPKRGIYGVGCSRNSWIVVVGDWEPLQGVGDGVSPRQRVSSEGSVVLCIH